LTLISPSNTPSEILSYRRNDRTNKGIKYFPFMTVFNWGESPIGKWTLVIESKSSNSIIENYGSIDYFALKLFGTVKNSSDTEYERMLEEKKIKTAFLPSLNDLKSIYDEEKYLSHNPRILKKDLQKS
jgi:subtilisin-like proprotein convertase family protein